MVKRSTSTHSEATTARRCCDPSHQNLCPEENEIHRLIHRGMDYAEANQLEQAEAAYAQALTLAETHHLPRWQAQALFGKGAVLDHRGKYTEAIPFFEQALALFAAGSGEPRMEVNVAIFLANMLSKTGSSARALPVLEQAKRRAEQGKEIGNLPTIEYLYECFGLYHELGRAYQGMGQFSEALEMYQSALAFDSPFVRRLQRSSLYQDILNFYLAANALEDARAFGELILEKLDPTDNDDLQISIEIVFQLGVICLRAGDYTHSLHYSQQTHQQMQQIRCSNTASSPIANDLSLLGRLFVNLGSAYTGLPEGFSFLMIALAYWRRGQELLEQTGAEDVTVPHENIAGLKRLLNDQIGAGAFDFVWKESEPFYQQLLSNVLPQMNNYNA
jgi:tetratricopeptide (TPR) repeat protein